MGGQSHWGGQIHVNNEGEGHVTIWNGDHNARVSFDVDQAGNITGAHGTDQTTGSHDASLFHAPTIEQLNAQLTINPDALGSAPITHPREP